MSFENAALRCRNCKYWWPMGEAKAEHLREHATRGQCRRHAPEPTNSEIEWAITQREDWCGEHAHTLT